MLKPKMPEIPGMNAMTDTLEFVKNLWGGMKVPGMGVAGMVMPTMSVEEVNKQIADLKAVEAWLTVNMNMLRATIQALEVQSATLATLQSMGENLNAAIKPGRGKDARPESAARPAPPPAARAADDDEDKEDDEREQADDELLERAEARRQARSRLEEEFKTTAERGEAKDPRDGKDVLAAEPAAPKPASRAKKANGNGHGNGAEFGAPLVNPAAWWNLLQDQFKQAVGNAMAMEPPMPAGKKGASGAGASGKGGAAKPAAKKSSATASKAATKTAAKKTSSTSASASGRKPATKKR